MGTTVHWFFSVGTAAREAVYYRDGDLDAWKQRRFVTPALLDLGWPVPRERQADLRLHLLTTAELSRPSKGRSCKHCKAELDPPGPSPRAVLEEELAPSARAAMKEVGPFEKRDGEAIWNVVRAVLERVKDGDQVVLETTNGIRSMTTGFLLASGLLLAHRKEVEVLAVTYAELGAGPLPPGAEGGEVSAGTPVFDLRPFLGLFDWAYAVRAMTERLDPSPTLALLRKTGGAPPKGVNLDALRDLGAALALNFPREIDRGLRAWSTIAHEREGMTPAEELALRHVGDELAVLGAEGGDAAGGEATIDAARLEFDLKLFERLVTAQRDADAARALREWIVNAVILAWDEGANWLTPKTRAGAEAALHGTSENGPSATLRAFWDEAAKYRNAVSHLRYNEKHDVSAPALRAFLEGAAARARSLLGESGFRLERRLPRRFLSDAVPLHTITRSRVHAQFSSLSLPKAKAEVEGRLFIGRDASSLGGLLGREVRCADEAVRLQAGDTVLVGETADGQPPTVRWTLVELS